MFFCYLGVALIRPRNLFLNNACKQELKANPSFLILKRLEVIQ
jgi:hypothetical protein